MSFNYVVQRVEKTKVCFGSGLERKTLNSDTKGLVSRLALASIKKPLSVGPGSYNIYESGINASEMKPTSKLGTVLGGRTAKRFFSTIDQRIPGPGEYNLPSIFPEYFRQSWAPFDSSTERHFKTSPVPGVGNYNVVYKPRTTPFKHSFGGKTCVQPAVRMKCGPFNFDTCERCEKIPEGDYWYLDPIAGQKPNTIKKKKETISSDGPFLCRNCYELEKKENKIFRPGQIKNFRKVRDCSKVHFHDGCKGKIFLVPPQEIERLKEREAYLSLYFD